MLENTWISILIYNGLSMRLLLKWVIHAEGVPNNEWTPGRQLKIEQIIDNCADTFPSLI